MKKRIIKILLMVFIIAAITTLTVLSLIIKNYDLKINDNNITWSIQHQGMKKPIDFTYDGKNFYIAFTGKIVKITDEGESSILIENRNFNITSLEYYDNQLYISTKSKIYSYNLKNSTLEERITGLPDIGDYNCKIIKINDNKIYISIGAATNSGVVGNDNLWLKDHPEGRDIMPYTVVLNGVNFGTEESGAFVPYKIKTTPGEKIIGKDIGTSTVTTYDLKNNKLETYAYGIRNITGMDFDSNNNLIAAVGGMEDRGLRPVKGDNDYIYLIQKGYWYGFPDYSGGDPIDSPRFNDGSNLTLTYILKEHPNINPSAPIYINKNLSSISALTVDKEGVLGRMNNIYFIDKTDKSLYDLNIKGVVKNEVEFKENININSMKFINKKLYVLDSNSGNLICFYKNENYINFYDKKMICSMIGIILVAIGVLLKILVDEVKRV